VLARLMRRVRWVGGRRPVGQRRCLTSRCSGAARAPLRWKPRGENAVVARGSDSAGPPAELGPVRRREGCDDMHQSKARTDSVAALCAELRSEAEVVDEVLRLHDRCLEAYEQVQPGTSFVRICALTALKAKNLALACYSLSLEGLAQEAGAVIRPLIETIELLTYLRLDPNRVEEVMAGKLPSAGR